MRPSFVVVLLSLLTACNNTPSKEEQEAAAKNTFACSLNGERLVIRFEAGEARMLMPTGERVTLYQIPGGSGVRFANGSLELRGKGADLVMIENGTQAALSGCQPFVPPAKS